MTSERSGELSSPVDYEIRPMRRTDYAGYWQITRLAIGPFERSTGLDGSAEPAIAQLSHRSVWLILNLARFFRRPLVEIALATRGGEVVGTATVLWLPRAGYVQGVATSPEMRGRGIASRILAYHAEQARRFHRAWLALDVESENETATRVYRNAGYRETGRFTWFTRSDLPPNGIAPVPPTVLPIGSADWKGLSARLDASRPHDYREAFPAGKRVLNHNEYLVRSGPTEVQSWKRELPGGSVAALRACFVTGVRQAVYLPMSTDPNDGPEVFLGLIDAATEWFRSRGPARVLAVASEPRGGASAALEQRGFAPAVSTIAMIAPLSK
jgi:ribosomal protein S18 acetylase RimI-like enzyme